jgi:hypothetical protein
VSPGSVTPCPRDQSPPNRTHSSFSVKLEVWSYRSSLNTGLKLNWQLIFFIPAESWYPPNAKVSRRRWVRKPTHFQHFPFHVTSGCRRCGRCCSCLSEPNVGITKQFAADKRVNGA